ncbi:protein SCO1 1, mitochondrial isoform X1 [Capsicum galapagoense]
MAKTIISTRNQQIRYLYHSLFSLQCCSTNPSFYLIHALSNTPSSPLALRLDRMGNGFISYRFLCTSTPTNQSNSGSGGSTNSGNIESSGGGCHKTDQGKSIRACFMDELLSTFLHWSRIGFTIMTGKRNGILKRRSLDLERDMVEQVGEYVKEFHPNLIGLTGSPEEIKKTARAYRVYYMKTEEEGLDYLVDHSIVMYLMDPKMDFVKYFGKNNDVDMLADGIIMEIKQYKRVKA